ncbi:MAG: nitrilase family protein [Flammeovirgaceae bacterium]
MSNVTNINITLFQTFIHWEDITANLSALEEKIWNINTKTDVIVLPEMFNTGFTMNVQKCAEPMNLTTLKWMKQMAAQTGAVITGSFIVKEKNDYFNRLFWVQPDRTFYYYDKKHLFTIANEHLYFKSGKEKLIIEYKGWKICPLICYDLRFPVWSRNRFDKEAFDYDILLYVANFPQTRIQAWDILLPARAIENLSYSVGVNRIGTDGNNILYNGHSAAYDYKGNQLLFCGEEENIENISLDFYKLQEYRKKFPAHLDADSFTFVI